MPRQTLGWRSTRVEDLSECSQRRQPRACSSLQPVRPTRPGREEQSVPGRRAILSGRVRTRWVGESGVGRLYPKMGGQNRGGHGPVAPGRDSGERGLRRGSRVPRAACASHRGRPRRSRPSLGHRSIGWAMLTLCSTMRVFRIWLIADADINAIDTLRQRPQASRSSSSPRSPSDRAPR